jgi:hypothetical protein
MQIVELSRKASLTLLTKLRLARLACAKGLQPYITPIHYAYHDGYFYSFSTVGQKINWMRANPLVCLEGMKSRVRSSGAALSFLAAMRRCQIPKSGSHFAKWPTVSCSSVKSGGSQDLPRLLLATGRAHWSLSTIGSLLNRSPVTGLH